MKKIIAVLLVLTMAIGLFAGCNSNIDTPSTEGSSALQRARTYIFMAYKDGAQKTTVNYKVMKSVVVDNVTYPIDWTIEVKSGDKEAVKIGESDNVYVNIVVKEDVTEETEYVLTATVKDDKGNSESVSFKHLVPGGKSAEQILTEAYALETGAALDGTYKLTGVVTKINTPWDDGYGNITVTIAVTGHEDKPVQCYRLKGDGAKDIAVGDTITVQGSIKNYNGTVEFDAACVMLNRVSGGNVAPTEPAAPTGSMSEIVDAAYQLETDSAMSGEVTLSGVVIAVNTPYDEGYKNVTVTIVVEGKTDKPIQCFRMKGDEAASVAVGDTITVTGKIKNYKGTVEFDAGCVLNTRVLGEGGGSTPVPTEPKPTAPSNPGTPNTPAEIVNAAFALAEGATMDGTYTLTGVVTKVGAFNTQYNDVTIEFTVEGKTIQCYALKAGAADNSKIAVGDTVTVTGTIKNYKGTVEFDKPALDKLVSAGGNNTPTETKPVTPPNNSDAPAASGTVTFDFTSLKNGSSLNDESAFTLISSCSSNASVLASVHASTVYQGNVSGGAKESSGGLIRLGKSNADGTLELSFGKGSKIKKVEILCHDYYAQGTKNASKIIINGGDATQVPFNATATPEMKSFDLDGSSNVLSISTEGRVCIYKIIVTFA